MIIEAESHKGYARDIRVEGEEVHFTLQTRQSGNIPVTIEASRKDDLERIWQTYNSFIAYEFVLETRDNAPALVIAIM